MIKKTLRRTYILLSVIGVNPLKIIDLFRGSFFYFKDLLKLKFQKKNNSDFSFGIPYPILGERFSDAGTMSGHYFHQDFLIAQRIYENKPLKHVDVGSRIDGFVAHVAVFRKIELFDIRFQKSTIDNIIFRQADLMSLSNDLIDYCDSISSLHAIEHFGLGRYGDSVDYYGHLKGINNLYKILKKGGKFYFSVPIGKQRIEFNAHRVFGLEYLLKIFRNKFKIDYFSYVDDDGSLHKNVKFNDKNIKNSYNCDYGCGIFEMTKL
jgi:SAM-dependent methyltransferase